MAENVGEELHFTFVDEDNNFCWKNMVNIRKKRAGSAL